MAENGEQVDRVEEVRPGDADDRHHHDEREDDADLLRQPEAAAAGAALRKAVLVMVSVMPMATVTAFDGAASRRC